MISKLNLRKPKLSRFPGRSMSSACAFGNWESPGCLFHRKELELDLHHSWDQAAAYEVPIAQLNICFRLRLIFFLISTQDVSLICSYKSALNLWFFCWVCLSKHAVYTYVQRLFTCKDVSSKKFKRNRRLCVLYELPACFLKLNVKRHLSLVHDIFCSQRFSDCHLYFQVGNLPLLISASLKWVLKFLIGLYSSLTFLYKNGGSYT